MTCRSVVDLSCNGVVDCRGKLEVHSMLRMLCSGNTPAGHLASVRLAISTCQKFFFYQLHLWNCRGDRAARSQRSELHQLGASSSTNLSDQTAASISPLASLRTSDLEFSGLQRAV